MTAYAPRGEPGFDIDYAYGRQGELLFGSLLEQMAAGQVRIENKRKRREDGTFYIEYEHDPYRRGRYIPSGIGICSADYWAWLIGNTGLYVLVPTETLRDVIRRRIGRSAAEDDGDNPTHGRLLTLDDLIGASRRRRGR